MALSEIFLEIQRIGALVRVCAIDAETGTEVYFQAPASAERADLMLLAKNKLRYVLKKQAETGQAPTSLFSNPPLDESD